MKQPSEAEIKYLVEAAKSNAKHYSGKEEVLVRQWEVTAWALEEALKNVKSE